MFENRLSSLRVFFSPFSPTQVQGLLMGWPQGIGTCGEDLVGAREVKGGGGGRGGRPPSYSHVSTRVLILIFIKKCSYSIKKCSYFV